MGPVPRFIDEQRARFVDELAAWVKIPSISSDPAHKADTRANAEHLVRELKRLNADRDFHLGIKSAAHLYEELSRLEEAR